MIERNAENRIEQVLSLTPAEDDPYADISPAQALNDAYLALNNSDGKTPEQYTQLRRIHSKRLLGVLESFTKRVIFGYYRDHKDQVHPSFPGSNQIGIHTLEIFSGITVKKDDDHVETMIDFAKRRIVPKFWGEWEYRITMSYDSDYVYQIDSPETFKRLEIDYLQPVSPDTSTFPISQRWKAVINNGAITYMEKYFVLPTDEATDEEPENNSSVCQLGR